MGEVEHPQSRWRWSRSEWVALGLLLALATLATWDAWREMAWMATNSEEQSHIILVPIIAAWLAWVRRERLRKCPRDGRIVGVLLVMVGWAMNMVGDLNMISSMWHLSAVLILVGCFLSFAGWQYLRRLLPAFAVLAFLVPVPGIIRQEIALPLQEATAKATASVLGIFGTEVERTGNALIINDVPILVAEACNGMRMAFALFLVSYTFAYSVPLRDPVRILVLVLSPLTGIVCNVIRIVPTALVHGYVSPEAGDIMHDIGPWIMLPIAFLLLLGVVRALRWALVPVYRYTLAYGKA